MSSGREDSRDVAESRSILDMRGKMALKNSKTGMGDGAREGFARWTSRRRPRRPPPPGGGAPEVGR
jgi:hypothetical protein